MTAPTLAAQNFLSALAIGAALGLIYGFLRPLRPRLTALCDAIFVLTAFWGWIYLSFGICAGNIRLGYTAGLFLGAVLWEMSLGRLLRPVFTLFWRLIQWPLKKIFEICRKIYKFLLAFLKKWVTMVRTITKAGGTGHGKKLCQAGDEANKPDHKGRHFGRSHSVGRRSRRTL